MIDKHLNENFSLSASRNLCCFNFDKYFSLEQQHCNTKALSLFSDMMLLFSNDCHGNNKKMTVLFQMCQTVRPQNFMLVLALQTEIFETEYCWIVHLSFLMSHNLLFFSFCKNSKKNNIFSFSVVFFLVKLSKSQSLKSNISERLGRFWWFWSHFAGFWTAFQMKSSCFCVAVLL